MQYLRTLIGRTFGRALLPCLLLLGMCLVGGVQNASAVDGSFSQVTGAFSAGAAQDASAGSTLIGAVGNTVSSIAAIITGPVLYIIMGLAIMISVFGFVSGKMQMAFSGIGAFILAAVLKALFTLVFSG